MEIFSKSNPILIDKKALKLLGKRFPISSGESQQTWTDNLYHFYGNYIIPNMFALIIFMLLGIFLFIKYVLKQRKLKRKKERKMRKKLLEKQREKQKQKQLQIEYYEPFIEEDIDVDDEDEIDKIDDNNITHSDNQKSIFDLENEYNNLVRNNDGNYSEYLLRDVYEKEKSKVAFNDMAKIVFGEI